MIVELLSAILESFIYDITSSGIKNWIDKWRLNKFLEGIREDIRNFCGKNECIYLDSSAFEYFIRNTEFLQRVIERAVTTKLEKTEKEFLRDEIKKAREIAVAENILFTNNEERIVRDLYHITTEKVENYYRNKLSAEQRHAVAVYLANLTELRESMEEFRDKSLANDKEILKAIKEKGKISDTKAAKIAYLLSEELVEGRFLEYNSLAKAIEDKSDDLAVFYECLLHIFCSEKCTDAVRKIGGISNADIRDIAVRTALPILVYRKEQLDCLYGFSSASSLKDIIYGLVNDDYTDIFLEKITFEEGVEIHNLTFNKKLLYEEEQLVKQIAIISLYKRQIRAVHLAMEELENGNQTWLTELLIADKRVDSLIGGDVIDGKYAGLNELVEYIQQYQNIYDGLCKELRTVYYSVLVKAYLFINKVDKAEQSIPIELAKERPLSDYMYEIKIEKNEVELAEVYSYSVQNETFWLLNNYFSLRRNERELIEFCRKHEDIFEKDWPLFFMYQGALQALGFQNEREKQLRKHSDKLNQTYEYWNELLNIDTSKKTREEFVKACQKGKMTSLFYNSEYLIIERLLNYQEYALAELYIAKHERIGGTNYRIKKYKAIIQQSKENEIEALKWYRASFDENQEDAFVIDSLITLLLRNRRNVSKNIVDAALKADTSRLHMLVAACYLKDGNISKAKCENIRAILMEKEGDVSVYCQYISISTSAHNNETVTLTGVDADTAVYCKKVDGGQRWLCIYKDSILPSSPYVWNNDYHVHIDDAARLGYLRKHRGSQIIIENELYEIVEIMTLDCYLFRTCMAKMIQNGVAKEIAIPLKDGEMDISTLTEMLGQKTPNERNAYDWLEQ